MINMALGLDVRGRRAADVAAAAPVRSSFPLFYKLARFPSFRIAGSAAAAPRARAECLLLLVPASQTDWFVIDVPFHAAVRPSGRPSILASPHLPLACMSPGQALGLLISLSNVL